LGFDDGNTTKTINIETMTKVEFRNGSFGRVLAKASGNAVAPAEPANSPREGRPDSLGRLEGSTCVSEYLNSPKLRSSVRRQPESRDIRPKFRFFATSGRKVAAVAAPARPAL
jgi:hypothetical protein